MGAVPERVAALLDPEQHAAALERSAIASLSHGELQEAFQLADRRCRILPVAQARHYTLRAEILQRSGATAAALKDIVKALELAPDDLAANRRLMQWGDSKQRATAARRLIGRDRDMVVLAEAVSILKTSGESALGALHRVGHTITGWAVWQGRGKLSMRIEDGMNAVAHAIESDPQHVLASRAEHAASFNVPFPASMTRRVARLMLGQRPIVETAFPPPLGPHPTWTRASAPRNVPQRAKDAAAEITVIVPVYDDFQATRRCLNSLKKAIAGDGAINVILVDDATPDPRIASLLDTVAATPGVRRLRNAHNLGFIGAVNRALNATPSGDVILLNADTVVPKGFARRLGEAAHAAPDIGTVTPLSNNGEATSLPLAFTANPLPSVEEIERLDAVAARVNAGRVVDMPDGIGFCLYITRSCLDAVGGLSDHYHRGYLEDVDLCLRARQHGFRNVCASSVYVGHAGSASFKTEKRALVVLNLERLCLRFPDYRNESATFKAQDPLKTSRGAIERDLIASRKGTAIILSGPGATADVAKAFALQAGKPALHATVDRSGSNFTLRDAGDGLPQSIAFKLAADGPALTETLTALNPKRIVLADPAIAPSFLLRGLADRGIVLDFLVADAGLWCRRCGLDERGHVCSALQHGKDCKCGGGVENGLGLVSRNSRIYAPDTFARAFLKRRLPAARAKQIELIHDVRRPNSTSRQGKVLGMLPVGHGASEFAFMCDVIRHLHRHRPDLRIVVLGETLDDLALIALGNVAVTGSVSAAQLEDLATLHNVGALLVGRRSPLFGHPLLLSAFKIELPLAFFDWSFGEVRIHKSDFAFVPSQSPATVAKALLGWSASLW